MSALHRKIGTKENMSFFLHDMFNILCVSVVTILDIYYLFIATDVSLIGTNRIGIGYNKMFQFMWYFFELYMIVDTIWVACVPSVASAGAAPIIVHHVLTLIYTFVPFTVAQFQWHMGLLLLAEINTLLLTLRRNVKADSILYQILNFLFLLSWVLVRLILFPAILVFYYFELHRYSSEVETYYNMFALGVLLQILLTGMALKWTLDLARKYLTKSSKDN